VRPGRRVIASGTKENLSVTEAENELGRVRQSAKGAQVARISVSWVIEE
jgi:hypothetical protein